MLRNDSASRLFLKNSLALDFKWVLSVFSDILLLRKFIMSCKCSVDLVRFIRF